MPNKLTESQHHYQALQQRFRARLPARLHDIVRLGEQWLAVETAATVDNEFQMLVHNLAGSAGSYGFPEIGGLCQQIEDAIRDNNTVSKKTIRAGLERLQALAK